MSIMAYPICFPGQPAFPEMANSTKVTEFLPMGFAEMLELRVLHALLFLLMYLATLLGNLLIISATTLDQNLHKPMYFFLRNLSILDMCYISITVPNACVNSLTDNRAISVAGCAAQIFLVVWLCYRASVPHHQGPWPLSGHLPAPPLPRHHEPKILCSHDTGLWSLALSMLLCTQVTHSGCHSVSSVWSISSSLMSPPCWDSPVLTHLAIFS